MYLNTDSVDGDMNEVSVDKMQAQIEQLVKEKSSHNDTIEKIVEEELKEESER